MEKNARRDDCRDESPRVEDRMFEIGYGAVAASRQKRDRSAMQAVTNLTPVIQRITFLETRSRTGKQAIIDATPATRWHRQVRYPPDDDFDGEQEEIINDAKNHQSTDVEAETDGRKTHQDEVAARLGQFLFSSVMARAVERIKIKERRDLMIQEQADLTAEKCFHGSWMVLVRADFIFFFEKKLKLKNFPVPAAGAPAP
jgi:hypothetical protein